MIDDRRLFEEAADRFTPPEELFERVGRRRDRKRLNRRVGTAALALVVAIAAVGGVVRAFREGSERTPASPTIDRTNVSQLERIWTATAGPAPGLLGSSVAVGGNRIVVLSDGLYVFPTGCSTAPCGPLWTASLPATGTFFAGVSPDGPVIADGSVIVAAGRRVFSFPLECGTGGARCEPSWTGNVGPGLAYQPVVSGGTVFLGAGDGKFAGRLYAFPLRCGTSGATCRPSWVSPIQPDPLLVQGVSNGVVYATNWGNPSVAPRNKIYAFAASCPDRTCAPLSVLAIKGEHYASLTIGGGSIYVGSAVADSSHGKIQAFPAACGFARGCSPTWTASVSGAPTNPRVTYTDGVVFAVERFGGSITAFDATDGRVLWTACCTSNISFMTPVPGDGLIWVPSGSGVSAFPVQCSAPCIAAWTSTDGASGVAVTATIVVSVSKDGVVSGYGLPHPLA